MIKTFLSVAGYPGVFLFMAIEGFGIPIPSELTMPFSGFLATAAGGSRFVLPAAIVVGALGEISGGVLAYVLGYVGGRPVLDRYGRFLLSTDELEKAERWFRRYGDWVVLVTVCCPPFEASLRYLRAQSACLSGDFSFSAPLARLSGARASPSSATHSASTGQA